MQVNTKVHTTGAKDDDYAQFHPENSWNLILMYKSTFRGVERFSWRAYNDFSAEIFNQAFHFACIHGQ